MKKRVFSAAVAAVALVVSSHAVEAATVDLGFALDESGSINDADFALAINGLANALSIIPTTGENIYRISVVAFSSDARTIVPVTDITNATLGAIQNDIRNIDQSNGFTAIGDAIALLTNNFVGVGLGDTSVINVTTDGVNNRGVDPATAASNASAAGIDGLSFEAVGSGADTDALLAVAFPGTPELVTDAANLPDITTNSFVFAVNSFDDYEAAIKAKVLEVIDNTGGTPVVPLPATLPLLLGGLGVLGFMRKRKAA